MKHLLGHAAGPANPNRARYALDVSGEKGAALNRRKLRALDAFAARHLGYALEYAEPHPISPLETLSILWSLNDVFRPRLLELRAQQYSVGHETAADRAIVHFAREPGADAWAELPAATWRVLLERHEQMLMTVAANHLSGRREFMAIPLGLPESARLGFAMLFWLYGMKLPWPPDGRPSLELPEGSAAEYLRRL